MATVRAATLGWNGDGEIFSSLLEFLAERA